MPLKVPAELQFTLLSAPTLKSMLNREKRSPAVCGDVPVIHVMKSCRSGPSLNLRHVNALVVYNPRESSTGAPPDVAQAIEKWGG